MISCPLFSKRVFISESNRNNFLHALAILKLSGEAGIVKVSVSGDGLEEASIESE